MSKTRASCFIRGSKHLEAIKTLGLRPRAFICFSVFGTPDETLALVFDILRLKSYLKKLLIKLRVFLMLISSFLCMITSTLTTSSNTARSGSNQNMTCRLLSIITPRKDASPPPGPNMMIFFLKTNTCDVMLLTLWLISILEVVPFTCYLSFSCLTTHTSFTARVFHCSGSDATVLVFLHELHPASLRYFFTLRLHVVLGLFLVLFSSTAQLVMKLQSLLRSCLRM